MRFASLGEYITGAGKFKTSPSLIRYTRVDDQIIHIAVGAYTMSPQLILAQPTKGLLFSSYGSRSTSYQEVHKFCCGLCRNSKSCFPFCTLVYVSGNCFKRVVISVRHRPRDTFSIYTLGAKGDSISRSLFEATAYA